MLTNTCDVDDQVFVIELLSDLHATRHTAHFYRSSGNAREALGIVLLNIDALVLNLYVRVYLGPLIKLLSFRGVSLILNLRGQLTANELLPLRSNLLGEFKCSEPVLQIHSHV